MESPEKVLEFHIQLTMATLYKISVVGYKYSVTVIKLLRYNITVFFPCSKRIFILGPSHHVHIPGCALSSLAVYNTPFYNLLVDNTGKMYFGNY